MVNKGHCPGPQTVLDEDEDSTVSMVNLSVFHHSHCKKKTYFILLMRDSVRFRLCSLSLFCLWTPLRRVHLCLLFPTRSYMGEILLNLFFFMLNNPRSPILPCVTDDPGLPSFQSFCAGLLYSLLYWGAQDSIQYSRCGLPSAGHRHGKTHVLSLAANAL